MAIPTLAADSRLLECVESLGRQTRRDFEVVIIDNSGQGLVRRNQTQRAHVYEVARSREWTQRQLAGDLLERAFSGSAKALLMGALSARKATKVELTEMRKLLDGYRKGKK